MTAPRTFAEVEAELANAKAAARGFYADFHDYACTGSNEPGQVGNLEVEGGAEGVEPTRGEATERLRDIHRTRAVLASAYRTLADVLEARNRTLEQRLT